MPDKHTSKSYEQDLTIARDIFLKMGEMVDKQIEQAIDALMELNESLAEQVNDNDQSINQLERQLDEMILLLVARRQPTANDLRFIMAMSKGVVDLERIGDEASKIARMVHRLPKPILAHLGYKEIQSISNQVRLMLHDAMNAFHHFNVDLAFDVMKNDRFINQECQLTTQYLINLLPQQPQHSQHVIHLTWVLRALERMGDHAKNVAELVIYMGSGTDVRHISYEQVKQAVQEAKEYHQRTD